MDIYDTSRTSIGLPLPLDAPAIRMFRMVIAEARSLIRQRNQSVDDHCRGRKALLGRPSKQADDFSARVLDPLNTVIDDFNEAMLVLLTMPRGLMDTVLAGLTDKAQSKLLLHHR